MGIRLILALSLFMTICLGQAANAGAKVALVIGNSAYEAAPFLKNPENDARLVGVALEEAGFEVTSLTDLGHSALIDALGKFSRRAASAETAVIYYAGHGMEIDRENFLIPVDARLEFASDAEFQAVRLDLMVRSVGGAGRLGIVIVDACRNNPFATRLDQAGRSRAVSQGMGRVEPRGNTLVAYAARENTVALDGIGDNSPYAVALASALTTPGLEIGKLFRTVRDSVMEATGGAQEPVLFGTLSAEDYYFIPVAAPAVAAAEAPAAAPEPLPAVPAEATVAMQIELAFWDAAEKSGAADEYALYLERYPDGAFAPLARARLARLGSGADAVRLAEAAAGPVVRGGNGGFGAASGGNDGAGDEAAAPAVSDRTGQPGATGKPAAAPAPPAGGDQGASGDDGVKPPPAAAPEAARAEPAPGKTSLVPVVAPPRDDTPAAQPVQPVQPAVPLPQGRELVRAVQVELNRLGCAIGPEDGIWGAASRSGVARMRSVAAPLAALPDEPGAGMLAALRGLDAGTCPPVCAPGETIFNGLCLAGSACPEGQHMSSKGTCDAPSPAKAATPARKAPAAARPAPPAKGRNCRVFNGQTVC